MEQELLVFFEGPARAIARLEPDHQSSAFAAWRAHYQIWDPGSYKAFVQAGCTAQGNSVILAEFTVTIVGFEGLNQRLTPCDFGHQGRWLLEQAKEDYYWTPYACAPPLASAESFSSGVRKRGFRRITFIGDSHQRMLYMHLKFLLNGLSIDSDYDRHVDMSSVVFRGKIDRELQLRFFWVDGIYRNGEDGCRNRGQFSHREDTFPQITPSADLFILDAGAWSATFCDRPIQVYTRHILPFLDWGSSLLNETGNGKGAGRLVWRTTPPSIWFCRRKNGIIQQFNHMTPQLLSGRNPAYKIFDSWQIEAPKFLDADPISHYSWTKRKEDGTLVMAGPVGEAVAQAFMTWTLETFPDL